MASLIKADASILKTYCTFTVLVLTFDKIFQIKAFNFKVCFFLGRANFSEMDNYGLQF